MSEIVYVNRVSHGTRQRLRKVSTDEVLTEAMNLLIAIVALVFLAPVMIAVAIAVFAQDGGPILFAHRRIGQNGRHFYCLKFRTMAVDAERRLADLLASDPDARAEWERDHKLRNDPRVTPLGAFLRRSSLDELPQLFNVLRSEMSLVGPRPIVDAEIAKYGRRFDHYCAVRPGITGLWQVSGRNDTTYARRVELDSDYARRANFWFDCGIVLRTVPAVVLGRGCY